MKWSLTRSVETMMTEDDPQPEPAAEPDAGPESPDTIEPGDDFTSAVEREAALVSSQAMDISSFIQASFAQAYSDPQAPEEEASPQ
ncbi:hypothetical protein [Sphingomonas sp. G-3-2-10]|uniref:hypothetical protein n=1 Tax=Sphingomonas sp. G-3-2-10 TaxID=2728838 RepID=UPI00146C3241|nr:hypothetical protein [Sphingomonas sp. G-3-2-10]NML05993.1 hypothetical protein [Sphingomonas sp. G-3-2-10]